MAFVCLFAVEAHMGVGTFVLLLIHQFALIILRLHALSIIGTQFPSDKFCFLS